MKIEIDKALKFYGLSIPIESRDEITKIFRKLSMKYHPDRGGNQDDFKLLSKYRNILEKNFYILNTTYSDLKKEEENIKRQQHSQKDFLQLIGYGAKKAKMKCTFSLNYVIEFLIYIIFFFPVYCIERILLGLLTGMSYIFGYMLLLLIYVSLFFVPFSFYTDDHALISEPSYLENGYITNGEDVWQFDRYFLEKLEISYNQEYFSKHGKEIYEIEKLQERKKLINNNIIKGIVLYGCSLLVYSIIYHIFLKPYMRKILDRYTKNKYLKFLGYTTIYYFLFWYLLFFIITQFILLIF